MLKLALTAFLGLALSAGAGLAQTFPPTPPPSLTPSTSPAVGSLTTAAPASDGTVGTGAPTISAPTLVTMSDGTMAQVFGSDLFSGAFASARPGANSNYQIQPGDQIAVRVFGAVNADAVQTVDTTGQLFIQGIGPITVAGIPASQLQGRVAAAIQRVYTTAVGVYVSVVAGGTLGVYVAGDVQRAGRYVGSPGDSLLYFLDQAGGIDQARGSFRNISVRRGGRTVATYDLYDFILSGAIAPFAFQDGDAIFVAPRGPLVAVTGDVRNNYAFETKAGSATITGREILTLAIPTSASTSATVTQVAGGLRNSAYYNLEQLGPAQISDGSTVYFRSEVYTETISVSLKGDLRGQTAFVLPRGSTLRQVIDQLPLDGSGVVREYIHIERQSVAKAQKEALNQALDQLLRTALTQPTLGTESAQAKAAEVTAIQMYVAQARLAQPEGKVAVYTDGVYHDLKLESGDVIVLPKQSDVVLVAGEVLSPGAFSHAGGLTAREYVDHAGGFSQNALKKRVVLRRADGTALVADPKTRPRAGDQIVVIPAFGQNRKIQLFRDLTQIAFQIATTAAILIRVN